MDYKKQKCLEILFEVLDEYSARDKYFKNITSRGHIFNDIIKIFKPKQFITASFDWASSPEGTMFWIKIDHEYTIKIKEYI